MKKLFQQRFEVGKWTKPAIVFIGFICIVGWVYAPVLTGNYGWNDDYHLLKRVAERSFDLRYNECLQGGRPILGLLIKLVFSIPRSVETLKHARYISVAGIFLFASLAFVVLRRIGFDYLFSAAAALIMCLTPGFAVYGGGLAEGAFTYAAILGLIAGSLLGSSFQIADKVRKVFYFCAGAICLLAAYAIYQPAAEFAVVPLFALACRDFKSDWPQMRAFVFGVGLLLAITVLYFVAFKCAVSVFHLGGQADRSALVSDFLSQAHFIVTRILWSGLAGWSQFNSQRVQCVTASVVLAVVLYGCCGKPWKETTDAFIGLICLALAIIVSILPLLAIQEQIFAFRTQTALHAVIGCAFLIGLERMIRELFPAMAMRVKNVAFVGLIFLMAGLTRFHLERDFVAPSVREVAILTKAMENLKEFPKALVFVVPAQGTEPGDNLGEFDYPTAALPWVARPLLQLLLIQRFENRVSLHRALQLHGDFEVRQGPANPDSLPVLDGFALLNVETVSIQDPYWGTVRTNQNGWCCSDWFGVFDNRRFPIIFHSQLGWISCAGKGSNDFWFSSEKYGWFWTNPKSYPSLLFKDRNSWFLLSPTIAPGCSFYDLEKKRWTVSPGVK